MEIYEPFSDLEKQISDMLDQLDKQEPLSTAACKQVVAGLEKIKEYQINPSPKSKKEKMPTMDVKIDDLIRGFHETADDSKQQLQSILALISEGRVPDAPAMSQINATVDKLREQYTDVCQAAAHSIPAEEMPQEGSPADAYVEAVKNSKFLEYRNQLDKMRKTLEKFVSVQSLAEMYATALAPYQKEAQELMQSINALSPVQKEDVAAFEEKTAGPAAFLKALACSDYDTDEGWELLDAVPAYYSRKVYTGLSRNQYFLPESTKAIPAPKDPAPVAVPVANAVETEEAIKTAASDMSTPEAVAEAAAPKTEVISPEKDADDSEAERWHKLGIDDPQTYLYLVSDASLNVELNPKAKMVFSAKKFESEITRRGDFSDNAYTLVTAWKMDYVDSEMLLKMSGGAGNYMSACESLFNLGYLQKYEVKGYPCFYALTDRGSKIFTTQKSAQLLKMKKAQGKQAEKIEDAASSALARVLLVHAFKLGVQIGGTEFSVNERVATDAFYLHIRYSENDIGCSFAGIIGKTIESFESVRKDLFWDDSPEAFEDDVAFIVLGMNKEHAHQMAEFFDKNIHDAMSGTMLCYYDYETKTCYRYADDTVVDLAELRVQAKKLTEPAPEPVQKEGSVKEDPLPEPPVVPVKEPSAEDMEATEEKPVEPSSEPVKTSDSTEEKATTPVLDSVQTVGPVKETPDEPVPEAVETGSAPSEAPVPEKKPDEPSLELTPQAKPAGAAQQITNDPQREKHLKLLRKMIIGEKFYCAAAYLRALSGKYLNYRTMSEQLSYALNDPAAHCSYTSAQIINTYFYDSMEDSDALVLAAALRNFFYDQRNYDSQTSDLYSLLLANPLLELYPELKNALYLCKDFKTRQHHGYDRYADYRQKDLHQFDAERDQIIGTAKRYYQSNVLDDIHEIKPNERFVESRKLVFKNRTFSFLPEALEFVSQGGTDPEILDTLRMDLQETYIRDDCPICRENIDLPKLDAVIDLAWENATFLIRTTKRKHERMVGDLHAKLRNRMLECIITLTDYVNLLQDKPAVNEEELIAARRCRPALLQALEDALTCCNQMDDAADAAILRQTLHELHNRVTGTYIEGDNRYFYQDFLRSNWVLLDEASWLPLLDEIPLVENFSILDRIAEHSLEGLPTFETRLKSILAGEDDYGSGRMILQLLEHVHPGQDLTGFDLNGAMTYAESQIKIDCKNFLEDLALAQSEGQITDDNRKEAYVAVTSDWFLRAEADNNYGFFRRIMDAIRTSIRKDAASRASDLNQNLEAYLNETPDWESSEDIHAAVQRFRRDIQSQNYAAAEDQLNRLKSNDLSTYIESSGVDDLQRFLEEYHMHLSRVSIDKKKTLQYLLTSYCIPHNKESRGATRLLESWPKNQPVDPNQIQTLMENLGFRVERVDAISGNLPRGTMFNVHLKHAINGVPVHYTHPIYIFGSQAETSGFQVVCLFGRFDTETLMEKMDSLGGNQNALILLDYFLTLQDRRKLARLTKKKGTNGKTIAVIDRIVISYLVQHYSETSVNRMLMSLIMPFASFQPYIPESSQTMPQEIFIGRRNELESIKDPKGPNIVYGGRQLGKSALLKKARKDIDHNQNKDRAVLVDIKDLDYRAVAKKITETLYDEGILAESDITENWSELSRSIRNRLRSEENKIPYLLLLLDEADAFLESCEAIGYTPFDALKEIQSMEGNRFKFIVAGLRNVVRFNQKILANNTVLPHMSSLTVKPFNSVEATELLEMPLRYLGFRFERDEETQRLISTILNTTNYFPGMLQLYCSKLIQSMQYDYAGYDENETPPYHVSRNHIKKTLADDTLRNQIREKFDITLHVGQDDYYYLIALLGAFHCYNYQSSSFSAQDILQHAKDYEIVKLASLPVNAIHALMEEMRDLNVLQSVKDGDYRFTRENFRVMMGSSLEEVDDKILEVAGNE